VPAFARNLSASEQGGAQSDRGPPSSGDLAVELHFFRVQPTIPIGLLYKWSKNMQDLDKCDLRKTILE
jgi:hypothetical protein